jgi:hypothetical protein
MSTPSSGNLTLRAARWSATHRVAGTGGGVRGDGRCRQVHQFSLFQPGRRRHGSPRASFRYPRTRQFARHLGAKKCELTTSNPRLYCLST